MKDFRKLLREMNFALSQIFIFNSLLNSILIFLIAYFILSVFNFYPIAAFIPAGGYFLIEIILDIKKNKARVVEGEYGFLREKLRTAADSINMENPVVEELREDIIGDISKVRLSSFINTRKIYLKIAVSIVLSFLIVFFATVDITIYDVKGLLNGNGIIDKITGKSDSIYADINESQDLYGKKSVAKLGNQELNIQIMPVNYQVGVREEGDAEDRQFDEIFPKDVAVESASAYEENIPKEQQELVKNYFNKLANP